MSPAYSCIGVCPTIDGVMTEMDDTGDCLIGEAPSDQPAWMWSDRWYYTDIPDGNCPYKPFASSGWDTSNCHVAKVPDGYYGFVLDQKYYTKHSRICPLSGSKYDGANCFVAAIPAGVNGSVKNNQWVYDACPIL
jgi:hypothetical protein